MNKKDFPLTQQYVFLDNASVGLKPPQVINAISDFYTNYVGNPHSGDSILGIKLNNKIKATRVAIARFLNADSDEVIFTSGATASLNILISSLFALLKKDDEVILFNDLHASAVIPWVAMARQNGIKLKFIFDDEELASQLSNKTKVVLVAQINNTNGKKHDIQKLYKNLQQFNDEIILINDACQAIVHEKVDFNFADAIVFSGGKLYGPSGIGGLILSKKLQNQLKPTVFGGGGYIEFTQTTWKPKPSYAKWEVGTPNTAGIIGLKAALDYVIKIGLEKIIKYESRLGEYAYNQLRKIDNVTIFSEPDSSLLLFKIKDIPSQDIVSKLGHNHIIARGGAHCAWLMKDVLGVNDTIRFSFSFYNDFSDIDKVIKILKKGNFLDEIL